METKRLDKIKLSLWGGSSELQEKLIKELSKIKLITHTAASSQELENSLISNQVNIGAVILTQDNFNHAMIMVKNIREKNPSIPIFVLVTSKEDGHLVTEAQENGVNDHFYFPIDIDLIATKLGRYFFQEDLHKFQLAQMKVPKAKSQATVRLNYQVTAVDENGITLKGTHMLAKGVEVKIEQSDLLHFLGVNELILVVEKSWADDDKSFAAYAEWRKSPEEMANAVRKWSMELNTR